MVDVLCFHLFGSDIEFELNSVKLNNFSPSASFKQLMQSIMLAMGSVGQGKLACAIKV